MRTLIWVLLTLSAINAIQAFVDENMPAVMGWCLSVLWIHTADHWRESSYLWRKAAYEAQGKLQMIHDAARNAVTAYENERHGGVGGGGGEE